MEKRKYHEAHKKMELWKSLEQLNEIVNEIIKQIPAHDYKAINQITNAHDSMASNFVEGYYAGYIKEFERFLTYGRRSGAELQTRVSLIHGRGTISDDLYHRFDDRCIKTLYLFDQTRKGLVEYDKRMKSG